MSIKPFFSSLLCLSVFYLLAIHVNIYLYMLRVWKERERETMVRIHVDLVEVYMCHPDKADVG